jgi:saccharopine dehydrogenase (NAD+, L-lysine-forming)
MLRKEYNMDKKTFLILGGSGQTGRLIAELLLQETDVQLILAGRNLAKAQTTANGLNQKFDGNRVSAQRVDAADPENLKKAFRQIDFVVVSSSTLAYVENVTKAALAAGIGYFDHQATSFEKIKILESMRDDIKQAGCCFITEGGVVPGAPAMLMRYIAPYFDRLEIAYTAFVMQEKEVPLAETLIELKKEWKNYQPLVFKDGKWNFTETAEFDFGMPFGKQSCTACYLDELKVMQNTISSLKETGFFIGMLANNWVVKYICRPLNLVLPKNSPKAAKRSAKLLCWGMAFNKPPYLAVTMLEAKGWKDDKYITMRVKLSHESSYFATAVLAVACLLQYISGDIKPGLWYQAHVVETKRMMSDIERLGIEVKIQNDE